MLFIYGSLSGLILQSGLSRSKEILFDGLIAQMDQPADAAKGTDIRGRSTNMYLYLL